MGAVGVLEGDGVVGFVGVVEVVGGVSGGKV